MKKTLLLVVLMLVAVGVSAQKKAGKTNSKSKTTAIDSRAVDLGLSVMWASCNVGASKPEECGDYFAWGETQPREFYYWSKCKWYNGFFEVNKYCTQSEYGPVDNKTALEPTDDAASANWGGSWRMPTFDEQEELRTKCTWAWTTQNGVDGYQVTGPNGNSIFLPVTGFHRKDAFFEAGEVGSYWTSSLSSRSPIYACLLDFHSASVGWYDNCNRYEGHCVRPVCRLESRTSNGDVALKSEDCNNAATSATAKVEVPQLQDNIAAVDLGLSVKWASCNVGATRPEEYGDYFSWGEVKSKDEYKDSNYKFSNGGNYEGPFTKYVTSSEYGTVDNKTTLDLEDDAAHVNWGGSWRMPTYAEREELRTKCTWAWTTQNGVNGCKVTGPNGNYIFLPAAGFCNERGLEDVGTEGHYWMSSTGITSLNYSNSILFGSNNVCWTGSARYLGYSVRAVCP